MKVADLLTDILIIGIPALFWLVLLVSFLAGGPGTLADLGEWLGDPRKAWLITLAVPFAYVLGVLVDRVSDSLLAGLDRHRVRAPVYRDKAQEYAADIPKAYRLRLAVYETPGMVAEFIRYQRGRVRVARASFVNLALITLLVLPFLPGAALGRASVFLLGVGISALTLWAWMRISEAYYRRLIDAYFLRNPPSPKPRSRRKKAE